MIRRLAALAVVVVLSLQPGLVLAQTEPAPVPAAPAEDFDIPMMLAVAGGAVLGVVFFNMLSSNVLAERLLEDLGRGIAMVGASALGGFGGHYVFKNWNELTASASH